MEEKLYTINEIIDLFKITRPTVYNWIDAGYLTAKRVGRRVYIRQSEVEKLLK